MQSYLAIWFRKNSGIQLKSTESFLNKPLFVFWAICMFLNFGTEMFRFVGHQLRKDKLLNTEHQQNPTNCSGDGEVHIPSFIHICRRHIFIIMEGEIE
jgi:hypothetical protein